MGLQRFSSRKLPVECRKGAYRDLLSTVMDLELDAMNDHPMEVEASFRRLPNVVVARSQMSPLSMTRTGKHAAAGTDDFILSIPLSGQASYAQTGRAEAECRPGDAFLLLNERPSRIRNDRMSRLSLAIPRTFVAPRIVDLDRVLQRGVPRSAALSLLATYARALTKDLGPISPAVERLVEAQICDLVVAALGATPQAAADARGRGIRAARLQAIKADITANLTRPDLSLALLATRHGISQQYARALFNSDGTTFSDFVSGLRLARAWRRLTDPAAAAISISAIAYEAGFGDLSYFNRLFRRAFNATPSEARAAALANRAAQSRE